MAEQNDKGALQAEAAGAELEISIYPRGFDSWVGTSAQLIEEGVLPADVEWPRGTSSRTWTDGPFDYWLSRRRLAGHREWKDVDNWFVHRTLASQPRNGFADAKLYEAQQALQAAVFRESHAGLIQSNRLMKAYYDQAFQAFKAKVLPERKKPGRRSKSQEGGSHA